jgi:hypothetical protein
MITHRRNSQASQAIFRRLFLRMFGLFFCIVILAGLFTQERSGASGGEQANPGEPGTNPSFSSTIYIPLIKRYGPFIPMINVPYFNGQIKGHETAILWFGKVTPTINYTDVRLGFNDASIWVQVSVIDRRLWYDTTPSLDDFTQWDSVSLYLNLDEEGSSMDDGNVYRFDAQLTWFESRGAYQAAYVGKNSGWVSSPLSFTTQSQWWGFPQPNDDKDDRAWKVIFSIPFQSLGLTGPPAQGSKWRLGVQTHDRDNLKGNPVIADQVWPPSMDPLLPASWQLIQFGLPGDPPAQAEAAQAISLRNGRNGVTVLDAVVGGSTNCGSGLDLWNTWGDHAYPGVRDLNVQNQGNTDDWPCFSKMYITFPLNSLPSDKTILQANLTLYQSGQATGFTSDPPEAQNSLIQVFQVGEGWDEATISWNNAPAPIENVSQAWVGSITMAELGAPRVWDITRVVKRVYHTGGPLYLVLYSADYYGPHGKYFFSSDSNDYDGNFRPQLDIILGE